MCIPLNITALNSFLIYSWTVLGLGYGWFSNEVTTFQFNLFVTVPPYAQFNLVEINLWSELNFCCLIVSYLFEWKGRGTIPINSGAREMASILDSALLQALLLTGQSSAALELLKGLNYCDIKICEEILQKGNHYAALLELYKCNSMHREALKLLHELVEESKSSQSQTEIIQKFSPESIIEYLKVSLLFWQDTLEYYFKERATFSWIWWSKRPFQLYSFWSSFYWSLSNSSMFISRYDLNISKCLTKIVVFYSVCYSTLISEKYYLKERKQKKACCHLRNFSLSSWLNPSGLFFFFIANAGLSK